VWLTRRLLKYQGARLETIVTAKPASYGAAAKVLGLSDRHEPASSLANNRGKTRLCRTGVGNPVAKVHMSGVSAAFSLDPRSGPKHISRQRHLICGPGLRILRAEAHEA
jgi:hypothetical protein